MSKQLKRLKNKWVRRNEQIRERTKQRRKEGKERDIQLVNILIDKKGCIPLYEVPLDLFVTLSNSKTG